MICRRCGVECSGLFCSNCGTLINSPPSIEPTNKPSSNIILQSPLTGATTFSQPDTRLGQQVSNPNYVPNPMGEIPRPKLFADGSFYAGIFVILSPIIYWDFSSLIGIIMAVIAIILGDIFIKRNGRFSRLVIVFGAIEVIIEILDTLILDMLLILLT